MNLQIAIPDGPDFVSYEEFAKQYGCSLNTVSRGGVPQCRLQYCG